MQTIAKMSRYSPQVDEPVSFVEGPPPVCFNYTLMSENISFRAQICLFILF